jgi:hypothetical protein
MVGGVVVGEAVDGVDMMAVWVAGMGLTAVAWGFDMRPSPSPRARPPATRAAISAVRIPSRLVN